jgi:branched-chain amino acid aminotransferase
MIANTEELIERNCTLINPDQELGVVHFVTPGENRMYAGSTGIRAHRGSTVCIHSFPLPLGEWRHFFTDGVHVVTPSIRHIPPQCIDPKMKNRSRLHMWIADQQSHAVDPKAVSLMLDLDGNITECSGANFVLVNDHTIYSPTSRNILEGVSLVTVRELAAELGWNWVEKDLQPYDVVNAEEAWLTTTPYCVGPCTRINARPIGSGRPGPRWREMLGAWSKRVGLDIRAQVMGDKA